MLWKADINYVTILGQKLWHATPNDSSLGKFKFKCNICGSINISSQMDREYPSCIHCGSSVRMRSIIHALSTELFGKSIPLLDFPQRQDITGIGISDWEGYALKLSDKTSYKNSFFDTEPRLDILNPPPDFFNKFNFIICSDVLEHVKPPVSQALINLRKMIKPGGFIVLTIPYYHELPETIEYYPDLDSYQIISDHEGPYLKNIIKNGKEQIYRNLVFHGGTGFTLELRRFSPCSVKKDIENAGFSSYTFYYSPALQYGIFYETGCCPIVLRK